MMFGTGMEYGKHTFCDGVTADAQQTENIRLQEVKLQEQSEEIKELKRIIHGIQREESLTPVKPMTPKHDLLPQQQGIHNNYTAIADNVQRTARQGMVANPVAFTAVKVINQDGIGVNQNIDFESVVLNDGGGYHANHGVFIALVSGYYLFTTSFLLSAVDIRVGLMHNGRVMAKVQCTNQWEQCAMTLVLKITEGDE
ncbi:hypothetical protein DPMN_013211, partial [Dreissena polymorpha]